MGLPGNERADQLAKEGPSREAARPVVMTTEGGLNQEWKKMREREHKVRGTGMGRPGVIRIRPLIEQAISCLLHITFYVVDPPILRSFILLTYYYLFAHVECLSLQ